MKKTLLTAAFALLWSASMYAFVEETEIMTVKLADGTTVEYNVDKIDQMEFSVKSNTYALGIDKPGQEPVRLTSLGAVLRCSPTETGAPYGFALGMVAGSTAEELRAGDYVLEFNVSASKINTGLLDVINDAVAVNLYKYVDGELTEITDELASGTVSTATNTKTKVVTLEVDVTFKDGTEVKASYSGTVTAVTSLDALNPAPTYEGQVVYFDADGNQSMTGNITEVTRKTASGKERFTFTTDNSSAKTCNIELLADLIGTEIDMPTAANNSINFTYGSIQVSSPNDQYRNTAIQGKVSVIDNGDGTFTIKANVTNQYKTSWGTTGGTPEYVIINYTGEITQQ